MCLKLFVKTQEEHKICHPGVFIVKFEPISHIFLVLLLLTLNIQIFDGILNYFQRFSGV